MPGRLTEDFDDKDDCDLPSPLESLRKELVKEDYCPKCLGELDTGWECVTCGFDARPVCAEEDG